jgi:hypothetical protein
MMGQGMGMQGGMRPAMPPQQGMGGFPQQQVCHRQFVGSLREVYVHSFGQVFNCHFVCRVSGMLVDFKSPSPNAASCSSPCSAHI